MSKIQEFKAHIQSLREQEATIRKGLNIFRIDHPPPKELAALEKDLEQLELVWQITKDWETSWGDWKSGKFVALQTKDMEETSTSVYKKLNKMSKELKDKNWDIVDNTKGKVDQFRR